MILLGPKTVYADDQISALSSIEESLHLRGSTVLRAVFFFGFSTFVAFLEFFAFLKIIFRFSTAGETGRSKRGSIGRYVRTLGSGPASSSVFLIFFACGGVGVDGIFFFRGERGDDGHSAGSVTCLVCCFLTVGLWRRGLSDCEVSRSADFPLTFGLFCGRSSDIMRRGLFDRERKRSADGPLTFGLLRRWILRRGLFDCERRRSDDCSLIFSLPLFLAGTCLLTCWPVHTKQVQDIGKLQSIFSVNILLFVEIWLNSTNLGSEMKILRENRKQKLLRSVLQIFSSERKFEIRIGWWNWNFDGEFWLLSPFPMLLIFIGVAISLCRNGF